MNTAKNINEGDSHLKEGPNRYKTLDSIDLTDIAQAIDGSKSPKASPGFVLKCENKKGRKGSLRFWVW